MDERKLEELFRDAAGVAPPASFDEQDVLRGSRRVTARRRMAAAGGSLAVAAVLAGGIGVGTGLFEPEKNTTAALDQPKPEEAAPRSPGVLMEPAQPSGGCGSPDGQLAQALEAQLPEVSGQRPITAKDCPSDARGAAFQVREGAARGDLSVILAPVGTVRGDDAKPGPRPDGTQQAAEKSQRSGKWVLVRSDPDGNSPVPFDERLPAIAKNLATRF